MIHKEGQADYTEYFNCSVSSKDIEHFKDKTLNLYQSALKSKETQKEEQIDSCQVNCKFEESKE